jgi:hypothetical protein
VANRTSSAMTFAVLPLMLVPAVAGTGEQPGAGHQRAHGGRSGIRRVREDGICEVAQRREVVIEQGENLPAHDRRQPSQPRQTSAADRWRGRAGPTGQPHDREEHACAADGHEGAGAQLSGLHDGSDARSGNCQGHEPTAPVGRHHSCMLAHSAGAGRWPSQPRWSWFSAPGTTWW